MATFLCVIAWLGNHVVPPLFSGSVVAFVLWLRTRPGRLEVSVLPAEHGTARPDPNARAYRHLRVANTRRVSPAHNVRLYLTEVAEEKGGHAVTMHTNRIPVPYQWEPENLTRDRTIGAPIAWDLCSIGKGETTVRVEVKASSWNWTPQLDAKKTYLLTYQAESNEVPSEPFQVSVYWDGEWDDDTRACAEKHLFVKQVRPLRRSVPS
jgi:hypothetical protein